jgi:hypothetical protein
MTAPDTPPRYQGACHCGAVRFELAAELHPAIRCNCSLCRRKGAAMSAVFPKNQLSILAGEDNLSLYQFNTRVARHFFCKTCGIYPFHQTRKDPALWRVNLGCLDGMDVFALEVGRSDGASLSVVDDA